jgi:hypothetical protein
MSDPHANVKHMFDTDLASPAADSRAAASTVPLERLEAQICELAGHLAAATCRFLVQVADFDARRPPAHRPNHDPDSGVTWPARQPGGKGRSPLRW